MFTQKASLSSQQQLVFCEALYLQFEAKYEIMQKDVYDELCGSGMGKLFAKFRSGMVQLAFI
jgi:hypothetical protein